MSDPKDYQDIHITTTLPKSWEEERTFNDVLYDWLGRAPYLAVALVLHLLALFLLNLVPWNAFDEQEVKTIIANLEVPTVEEFEEPPPPEIEVVEEVEVVEPVVEVVSEEITPEEVSEDQPFDNPNNSNTEIGIGGGGGGGKGGGRRGGRGAVKTPIAKSISDGLEWLKDHQNVAGYWDVDNFMVECKKAGMPLSDGPGSHAQDVGVTGLALLAFLGYGDTLNDGQYKDVISRGVQWLILQQQDSGLIGGEIGLEFLYDHSIAALALCEAYYTSGKRPLLRKNCQAAINYISRARNPYAAWRYAVPANGENDTSVTGWMVFAMAAALDGGLTVDIEGFRGAMSWFDEATDPQSGRVGYDSRGGASSRSASNGHYPREAAETMTAVGVLGRIFAANALKSGDPTKDPIVQRGAELMSKKLPVWSANGLTNDMYYWYYGSYAMFQMGGRYWGDWEKAMEKAILPNQRQDGCFLGSWDPNGPWGYSGGRVYSTALMVLCLEVFFRYTRLTGAR